MTGERAARRTLLAACAIAAVGAGAGALQTHVSASQAQTTPRFEILWQYDTAG
jgi:hypothetical protein